MLTKTPRGYQCPVCHGYDTSFLRDVCWDCTLPLMTDQDLAALDQESDQAGQADTCNYE